MEHDGGGGAFEVDGIDQQTHRYVDAFLSPDLEVALICNNLDIVRASGSNDVAMRFVFHVEDLHGVEIFQPTVFIGTG